MLIAKRVAVLATLLTAFSGIAGCNNSRSTSNQTRQADGQSTKSAKWIAQYRSPLTTGLTGPNLTSYFYSGISVVNQNVVFVCGDMPAGKNSDERIGVVLKTVDGGQKWSESTMHAPGMSITTLNGIHFINENMGWLVGAEGSEDSRSGVVLKTTDGGTSWSAARLVGKQIPTTVLFTDENTGFIGGATPPPGEDVGEGGPSAILGTTDGGKTWQPQINLSISMYDLYFLDKMNGWASGSKGSIYHTNDGGRTWNSQRTEIETGESIVVPGTEGSKLFRVLGVQFTDPDHGFAAAAAEEEDAGRLLATTNGGVSWTRQWVKPDSGIRDTFFLNRDEGWAVTERGSFVYHTVDGGRTWLSEQEVFEQECTLVRIGAADASHVWAVGASAVFFRVSD